jgi:predicted nucleic acid-binding protein
MEQLYEAVCVASELERRRAYAEYGELRNLNEAYGVLAEEMDEVDEDITRLVEEFSTVLRMIHHKDDLLDTLSSIRNHAKLAACECIQVAAVAERFLDLIRKEDHDDGSS